MERLKSWNKIRDSIPSTFYESVNAKNLSKELRLCTPVLKDTTDWAPSTVVERYYNELDQLDEEVATERGINDAMELEFATRWQLSHDKQGKLEEILGKFHTYFYESREKAVEDMSRCRHLQNESLALDLRQAILLEELELLKKIKTEVESRRDICEPRKHYLQTVLSSAPDSQTIQELIGRFQELKQIRDDKATGILDNFKTTIQTLQQSDRERYVGGVEAEAFHTYKKNLASYLSQTDSLVGQLNSELISKKERKNEQIVRSEQCKKAVNSLYLNTSRARNHKQKVPDEDIRNQLKSISEFISQMKGIREGVSGHLKGASDLPLLSDKDRTKSSSRSSL